MLHTSPQSVIFAGCDLWMTLPEQQCKNVLYHSPFLHWGGKWNHCSFVNLNSMSFYCNPLKYKWCHLSFLSVGFKRTFQLMLLTEMAAPKWAENFFLLWSFSCFDLHKRKSFLKQAICYGPLKWHSVALRKSEAFVELLYQ